MSKKGFKAFSYDTELFFEFYVQFEDYKSFEACMSSFRNMKLVMKESETKAFATAIKVTRLVFCRKSFILSNFVEEFVYLVITR